MPSFLRPTPSVYLGQFRSSEKQIQDEVRCARDSLEETTEKNEGGRSSRGQGKPLAHDVELTSEKEEGRKEG